METGVTHQVGAGKITQVKHMRTIILGSIGIGYSLMQEIWDNAGK